jgi:hypothetical protein
VPADLEAVILKCLAKQPDQRPSDARALRAALRACSAAKTWSSEDAAAWWRAFRDAPPRNGQSHREAVEMTVSVDVSQRLTGEVTRV